MRTRKNVSFLKPSSLRRVQTRRARALRARTTLKRRRRGRAHSGIDHGQGHCSSKKRVLTNGKVSDKLETLKNLIPCDNGDGDNHCCDDGTIKADQLFQKTADYIILLRTRVLILQSLIQLYGSSQEEDVLVL